ncbi:MAG TPA: TetR/AcrR family transcriptional regulator [candidate division Zixibacteria bacterium]|nr:TetR/AcrR family transcriptional regulator [candidate division Zixibacteria bacterium]
MGITERKEREKLHRKEEILNAAETVFFEKGLAASTMDEIADRAELSKGTLYLYYKSKEDLYMAIICRGHQILFKMFQEAAATGESSIKLLENLGQAYFTFYKRYHDYFRMFSFSENTQLHSQVSEEMKNTCAESGQCLGGVVQEVIRKGIEDGSFRRETNPVEMSIILWAHCRGVMEIIDHLSSREVSTGKPWEGLDFEKMYRRSTAMLVSGILTDEARKNFKLEL